MQSRPSKTDEALLHSIAFRQSLSKKEMFNAIKCNSMFERCSLVYLIGRVGATRWRGSRRRSTLSSDCDGEVSWSDIRDSPSFWHDLMHCKAISGWCMNGVARKKLWLMRRKTSSESSQAMPLRARPHTWSDTKTYALCIGHCILHQLVQSLAVVTRDFWVRCVVVVSNRWLWRRNSGAIVKLHGGHHDQPNQSGCQYTRAQGARSTLQAPTASTKSTARRQALLHLADIRTFKGNIVKTMGNHRILLYKPPTCDVSGKDERAACC